MTADTVPEPTQQPAADRPTTRAKPKKERPEIPGSGDYTRRDPPTEEEKPAIKAAVRVIADELGETLPDPKDQLKRLAYAYGVDFLREHVEKAKARKAQSAPESDEEQIVTKLNGKPRTLGGVFFKLVYISLGTKAWYATVRGKKQRKRARDRKAKARIAATAAQTTEAQHG